LVLPKNLVNWIGFSFREGVLLLCFVLAATRFVSVFASDDPKWPDNFVRQKAHQTLEWVITGNYCVYFIILILAVLLCVNDFCLSFLFSVAKTWQKFSVFLANLIEAVMIDI
jgi:hypothetical protein